MADVVIAEVMDEAVVAGLAEDFDVYYDPNLVERRSDLLAAVADCRALVVRNRTIVDADVVRAAPALRVVGRLGVGLDNIDLEACAAAGVEVCPATGANAVAVAEYVIAAMLLLLRRIEGSSAAVAAGTWPRQELVGREAHGRTMGLVGLGGIAREVARRAGALGMEVAAHDPLLADDDPAWQGVARRSLPDLLAGSDVISLHVPLTGETRGLIDAAALAAMRPDALLINTSRGGIVDEGALATSLRTGRLGGAALDVFADEPLDAAAGARFDGVPNLLLTPHVAGLTEESQVEVAAITAANVRRFLAATP